MRSQNCQWKLASSTKVSASTRARATHQQGHAPPRTYSASRPKQVPNSPRAHVRSEPREPEKHTQRAIYQGKENAKQRRPKTAPKGTNHPASSKPPLPAVLPGPSPALRRTLRHRSTARVTMWPQQAQPPPSPSCGHIRDRAVALAAACAHPSSPGATSARAGQLTPQPALRAGRRGAAAILAPTCAGGSCGIISAVPGNN